MKKHIQSELERRMKFLGALQIVEEMQRTCNLLYEEFGVDIFPHGVPILTRPVPQPKPSDKAQQLIKGAEALRAKHRGRPAKRRKHGSSRMGTRRIPKDYHTPEDSPDIMMNEAAVLAGVSSSYIRQLVVKGTIQQTGKNEYGIQLVRRSDVMAWAAARSAREAQGEPDSTDRLQDEGQRISA